MECWECEFETKSIHHHHIIPRSRGGIKTVPLCESCHAKAHHMDKNMDIIKLTKEALTKKKARGEFLGRPPLGFSRVAGCFIPNDDFKGVLRCLDLLGEGATLRATEATLTDEYPHRNWQHTQVGRISRMWQSSSRLLSFVEEQKKLFGDKLGCKI